MFGSHWKGHFLHLVFLFAYSMALSFFYRSLTGRCAAASGRAASSLVLAWASVFLVLEWVFGGAAEAVSDARTLAHELREILTHAGITAPLCMGVLARLEAGFGGDRDKAGTVDGALFRKALFCLFMAGLPAAFILVRLNGVDVLSLAQTKTGMGDLLAGHAFEHALDYAFTALVASFCYTLLADRGIKHV